VTGQSGRWWWVATGIVLIIWALQIFGSVDEIPAITPLVIVLVLWGLAVIIINLVRFPADGGSSDSTTLAVPGRAIRWENRIRPLLSSILPWATALVVVVAFVVWSFLQVRSNPSYGTDEVAFDQYAATLALHGQDPYTHSMEPSFALYRVSPNGFTFHLDGTPVTSLSYPALSFELYLPFLALGWSSQLGIGINVLAWAVVLLLLFGLLPRHNRASALVIGSLTIYVGYAVGGVTDALYVPLLVGAAFAWERATHDRPRLLWLSAGLFGLAMAVKQTPWLVLPFVLLAIAAEGRRRNGRWALRPAAIYFAIAAGTFLVPNLPYVIESPHAWWSGILTPLISHTVPAGQGLIGVSLFLHVGGGSLAAYSLATVIVLVVLGAIYLASYPLLRSATFVLPSLALFFSARSFGSYLIMLAPIALLAAATRSAPLEDPGVSAPALGDPATPLFARWRLVAFGGVVGTGAACAFALLSSAPLTVVVTQVHTTGQLATVERITVRVTNKTGGRVKPAFSVENGGVVSAFWPVLGSERTLAPHQTLTYTILSPNFGAQPPISGGFAVAAFTSSPSSVSTSGAYLPSTWHVGLIPDAISRSVPLGTTVTVHAELLDQFDRRVRQSEIPVYMGQIIYDQRGLLFSSAVINGSSPGTTPVTAYTNAQGVATFTISSTSVSPDPVYFEANLVNFNEFFPYGYSEILPIRFGSSS
jgi:hypothetical protein